MVGGVDAVAGRTIVVLGGGAAGLTTAIVLANAGASVTLLERDAQPPTSSADEAWDD